MKTIELEANGIKYEIPQVRVIEVEVEKRFAVSGGNDAWEEE